METLLLTRKQAASILGVSTRSIDHLIRDQRIAVVRLGGRTMVHRNELERIAREGIPDAMSGVQNSITVEAAA